ncbi:MAG: thioredoxin [Gammaproteobacteria bacterium]
MVTDARHTLAWHPHRACLRASPALYQLHQQNEDSMSESAHIIDISNDNFATEVIEASAQTLVLLDFWATWCGPCQALMPVVSKLAEAYNGAIRLAKVNIDEQQALATQFAVRSVPTVKLIKQGQVVDEFSGALPEGEIRKMIDRHIVRESDRRLDAALAQYAAGDHIKAIEAIQDISKQDPDNPRIALVYADLMIQEGRYDLADEVLQGLPYETRQSEQAAAMLAKIEFATAAADLPDEQTLLQAIAANPKDSRARHQLSTLYTLHGQYEQALAQLLEIVRRDRQYEDDAGRKAMLKLFDMLGDHALVHEYRRKMMAALY